MDGQSTTTTVPMDDSSATISGQTAKRRRKNDGEPSEPRRLRRSHEACTRCRGKKIKCDSKHPRCTACVTAGVACNQEDRHRQTTIARDHTERLEQLVAQCDALLKRHIPDFTLESLEDICARAGLDVSVIQPIQNLPLSPSASSNNSGSQPAPPMHPPPPTYFHPNIAYYQYPPYIYPPPPFQVPPIPAPATPAAQSAIRGQDPKSNDMSSTQALAKSFGVAPSIVNDASTSLVPVYPYLPPQVMYNAAAPDAPVPPVTPARLAEEDLAVGSSGLDSGRDRVVQTEMSAPRDTAKWRVVSVFRSQQLSSTSPMDIWIPNDRATLLNIVDVYFTRLNPHRPVFLRHQFLEALDQLYNEGATPRPVFDPGFICSVYLVLALGTLSKLNRSGYQGEIPTSNGDGPMDEDADGLKDDVSSPRSRSNEKKASNSSPDLESSHLPPDWPAHDEFFDRALAVKPELRVTLSSLQALILLHWYLYAERQGRTLWRLVGSMVRLAIELGLHHDPTTQMMPNPHPPSSPPGASESDELNYPEVPTFTSLECILRIRLWSIVLVHDRGTSILLGRPLAIAPSDSNTPRPPNPRPNDPVFSAPAGSTVKPPTMNDLEVSEHFLLSAPIAEIQADIIISLYSPTRQSGETLVRNASRIIRSINLFRRSLPLSYEPYFTGTANWSISARHNLLANLSESMGLTLLKLAISRILLLRALFNSKELGYTERKKALVAAIVQAHNVIAIHTVLVRFPEVGFFTSAVPLHIAAMVILYGRMSKCDEGIPGLSDGEGGEDGSSAVRILMEDVWLALDMLPRFRWRWETGSGYNTGTNPLIAKLAEKVMEASFSESGLHGIGPVDEPEQPNSTPSNERSDTGQSRLITGLGRQGPIGRPVLIPESEWEDGGASPNRDKSNASSTIGASTGSWDHSWNENTASPKGQQATPTSHPVPYSSSSTYPPSSGGAPNGLPYSYPPHTTTNPTPPANAIEKPNSKAVSISSTSTIATPVTPINRSNMPALPPHMVEVPQILFYPFSPDSNVPPGNLHLSGYSSHMASDSLLSPPPLTPRVPRSSGVPGTPISTSSGGRATNPLFKAVAIQAHGQQDAYINEDQRPAHALSHPVPNGYIPSTYHTASTHYSIPPPPPPPPSASSSDAHQTASPVTPHLHHSATNGSFPAHPVNGHPVHGSIPTQHSGWVAQHVSPP
ncbi:hypothetical protein D9757_001375 [Collybiopsis confluens]|uniref:Zn(2)-C6 fungal-type domain-containing protein n=1 Tax=Collybiopsis confluens TaxID=2823264 RepID=A0A8H5HZD1_9AGAR|nr:hypothetical protein D9757_001375 [Collybiopsis confluens]